MTRPLRSAGDFFDFMLPDDDRLPFAIGGVSGKGLAAALLMAVSRRLLRAAEVKGLRPDQCLHEVNRIPQRARVSSMSLTCLVGVLDTRTGANDYSNGGHNPLSPPFQGAQA